MARRFAIVSPNFYPRVCGIGDHSARLAAELRRRGHEAAVFSRQPVARHPEAPAVAVYGVPGSGPEAIAREVAVAIAEQRPTDVIIQYTSQMWNTWRFGSAALPWLAERSRAAGAQVTLVAHELFVPWYGRPDLLLAAWLQRAQFAALLRSCAHVFVTTESRLRHVVPFCETLHLAAPGVIRVGANALPAPRPVQPAGGWRGDVGPRIGVFSTAAVGKRFDVVLDVFAQVASERPAAQLVLIGDLGPADRPAVRSIRDALALHPAADRIRVTGRLPLWKIASEVSQLDVYLFPMNTGANTRSGTLPVALGSGLPVVAILGVETDVDLFRDGENIVFARDLSGPAFTEATLRLLRDPSLMARVGRGAARLYADHLSWQRIADQLLSRLESR